MSSLIYELTKQSVSLERLDKLDGVLSSFRNDQFLTGTPSQVYGVKPKHNFPIECNPKELDHIAYVGISAFNDKLHLVDFMYEEKYEDGSRMGIIEPSLRMLSKDKLGTMIAPRHVPEEWVEFWMNYFKKEFNCQKTLLQFVEKNNLHGSVDWTELYNSFPENMDLKLSN
jgi:hypothetical protein